MRMSVFRPAETPVRGALGVVAGVEGSKGFGLGEIYTSCINKSSCE